MVMFDNIQAPITTVARNILADKQTAVNGCHCLTIIHNVFVVNIRRRGRRSAALFIWVFTGNTVADGSSSAPHHQQQHRHRRPTTCVDSDQTRNCLALIMKWPGGERSSGHYGNEDEWPVNSLRGAPDECKNG